MVVSTHNIFPILTQLSKVNEDSMADLPFKKAKAAKIPFKNANTTAATTNLKGKQPTTFLTLPRELRQKILYLSCDLNITIGHKREDVGDCFPDICEIFLREDNTFRGGMEKSRTLVWKRTLDNIHKVVRDDMMFVYGQWEGEIEEVVSVCVKKDKEMVTGTDLVRYESEHGFLRNWFRS